VILLVHAHPRPRQSIAGRALLDAVHDLPHLAVHALYDVYPDFSIDVTRERHRLAAARLVVWQHPFTWYGVPSLLKLWFEEVLGHGWAFGDGGTALHGKDCLWVTTTGAPAAGYAEGALHGHAFDAFVPGVRQVARFCGMNWLEPIVVHGAHRVGPEVLAQAGAAYRARLTAWIDAHAGAARG
jgi:glutathione-regulated potassium-efflux system ancillary protein KefF